MISYAGVALNHDPDGRLSKWLESACLDVLRSYCDPITFIDHRNQAAGLAHPTTPLPAPNYPPTPAPELCTLHWPSGATRWSTFFGIADRARLLAIQSAVKTTRASGSGQSKISGAQLVLGDSKFSGVINSNGFTTSSAITGKMLSTEMFLLTPIPVSLPAGFKFGSPVINTGTVWILPLVDARYFWQFSRLPSDSPIEDEGFEGAAPIFLGDGRIDLTSFNGWVEVFNEQLTPPANLTLQSTTVDDAYRYPDVFELWRPGYNAAAALDAFAHSIGRRVVRMISGHTLIVDPDNSVTRLDASLLDGQLRAGAHHTIEQTAVVSFGNRAKRLTVMPEFVDVTFRKLVEFTSQSELGADDGEFHHPHELPAAETALSLDVAAGVRIIRVRGNEAFPSFVKHWIDGTRVTINTPSWVGWEWINKDTIGISKGSIDSVYYGDRYVRLAKRIAGDWYKWHSTEFDYSFIGMHAWQMTGFDDYVQWKHDSGLTSARSLPNNFGVATQLIQVHRQGVFQPDQVVGMIAGKWRLYTEDEEAAQAGTVTIDSCGDSGEEVTADDLFADTWKYVSVVVRPFMPADPYAGEDASEYNRRMVWAGPALRAVSRSKALIATIEAAVAESGDPYREACGPTGTVYLRRYGHEWQIIERDQASSGGSGGTIRFSIYDADCSACSAIGEVLSRSDGVSAVTGEYTLPEVNDDTRKFVDLTDKTGAYLNEPDHILAGRMGYAAYLTGPAKCYYQDETSWEIIALAEQQTECEAL